MNSTKLYDTVIGTILGACILTIITLSYKKDKAPLDLEIYTDSNIYYINDLTVTNEVSTDTLRFKDMETLKIYISDITSGVVEYHY